MKRISLLAGAIMLGSAGLMGQAIGIEQAPTVRTVSPQITKRKKVSGGKRRIVTSKYMPHIGKKEQERAKRCYMVNVFGGLANPHNKNPRSAPTLSQAARPYPF